MTSTLDRTRALLPSAWGIASRPAASSRRQPRWVGSELQGYRLRLAENEAEREAVCRLRFRVFNLEMGEGLAESYSSGLDRDAFDEVCEHLVVEQRSTARIVGTYRMQSGLTAQRRLGYYGAREFDFQPYEPLRPQMLELGRACIEREHRSSEVLTLLWRGIVQYAEHHGLRYLIGCSSVPSRPPASACGGHSCFPPPSEDAATGWAMYQQLTPFLADAALCTRPVEACRLPAPTADTALPQARVPKLLRTYLAIGARICSGPAWDRSFGTIDFLTLQDMRALSPSARSRFLGRP